MSDRRRSGSARRGPASEHSIPRTFSSVLAELQPHRTYDEWHEALGRTEREDLPDLRGADGEDVHNNDTPSDNASTTDAPGDDAAEAEAGRHHLMTSGEANRGRRTPSPPPARVRCPHTPTPTPAYLPTLPSIREVLGSPLPGSSRQAYNLFRPTGPAVSAVGLFSSNRATTDTTGQGTASSGNDSAAPPHSRPSRPLQHGPPSLGGALGSRAATLDNYEVPQAHPASPAAGLSEAGPSSSSSRKDKGKGRTREEDADEKARTTSKGKGRAREDDEGSEDKINRKRFRTLSSFSRRANRLEAEEEAEEETRYPPCLHPWRAVHPNHWTVDFPRLSRTAASREPAASAAAPPAPACAAPSPVVAAPLPAAPVVPAPPGNFVWVAPLPGGLVPADPAQLPSIDEAVAALLPPPCVDVVAPMLALPPPPAPAPAQVPAPAAGPARASAGPAGPANGEKMSLTCLVL